MSERKISSWYRTPFGAIVARSEPPGRIRPTVRETMARLLDS